MTTIKFLQDIFAAFIIFCDKKDFGDRARKMIPTAVRKGMREWQHGGGEGQKLARYES
jgi:hypothetical protein